MDLDDLLKEYWPIVVGVVVVLLLSVVLWPSGEAPQEAPLGPVAVTPMTEEAKQALRLKQEKDEKQEEEQISPAQSPALKAPLGQQARIEFLEILEAVPVEREESSGRKYTTDDPEVRRALGQVEVTLYQEKECAPCVDMRAYLTKNGVTVTAHDVQEDANLRERARRLSGSRSLPVMVVDGKTLQGFSETAVQAALVSAVKSRVEAELDKIPNR